MVNRSWKDVFNEELIQSYDNCIDTLKSRYRYNNDRKDLRYWTYARSNIYCIPSLLNIYRPFNEVKLNNVSCIVLFESPYPDITNAAGIPFSNKREFHTICEYISKHRDKLREFNSAGSVELINWLNQGILPLYAIPTTFVTDSSKINRDVISEEHNKIWYNTTKMLIQNIYECRPDITIICYSNTGKSIIKELLKSNVIPNSTINNTIYISKVSIPDDETNPTTRSVIITEALLDDVNKNMNGNFMYMW